MAEKKLVGGLKWVKSEIGATLRPVRDLVEAGGAFDAETELAPAVTALEQVHGVLLALQLTTPARLLEEMRRLAERIADGDGGQAREVMAVMGRALGQLANHLDRLDAGFDEPPLSLWTIINEVRSACSKLPLTHSELLTFAAVGRDGDSQWMPEELDILAEVMRQVRPQFHRHLVEWYRGDPDNQGLLQLSQLFHQLQDYLKEGLLADLFRLAEVFSESIRDGRLETGARTRTLMGHLDWVQKPLTQRPPQWPEVDGATLIEQLLGLFGECGIDAPIIGELRAKYGQQGSGVASAPAAAASLESDEAIAELAIKVLSEFAGLKEEFDHITHGEQASKASIDAFGGTLRRLAGGLDEVEVGNLPSRMRALADNFGALEIEDIQRDIGRLESYAMELLGIEAVLLAYAGHRTTSAEQIIAPDMDLSELTSATLREAGYELLRIKDLISNWQAEPGTPEALAPIEGYLLSVAGALRILGENPAADLAESIGSLVQRGYVRLRRLPTEAQLEHLADAVAGLELYIGHLQDAMPLGDRLVDRAGESISALYAEIGDLNAPAEDAEVAEAETARAAERPAATHQHAEDSDDDVETEFLDIFLEEAREETEVAQAQFARWESNPYDAAALSTLRRSFHTLKGSGRLVGALQMGDFAQAIEFLLNRLIESKAFPSEDVLACIAEAVRVLPDLVDAEAEGRLFDIEPHVTRANQLRGVVQIAPDSEAIPDSTGTAPAVASATPGAAQVTDHDSLFLADEELLRIFQTETREHLAELRAFLRRVDAGDGQVDEAPQRALHTLTGSARMAGIDSIARVTKGLELCIKPFLVRNEALAGEPLALVRRAVEAVEARIDELPAAGAGASALTEVFAEIERLIPPAVEPASEAAKPEAQPEEESTSVSLEIAEEASLDLEFPVQLEIEEAAEEAAQPPARETEREPPPISATAPPPPVVAELVDAQAAPDPELATLFLEDARDLLDNLDRHFREWQLAPQDTSGLDSINRLLHTLKGSARLTGLSAIGDLSHALETRLKAVGDDQGVVNDTTLELAQRAVDTLSVQVDALEQGVPIPRMTKLVEELSRSPHAEPLGREVEPDVAVMRPAAPEPVVSLAGLFAQEALAEQASGREGAAAVSVTPQIRVRSDLLNRLVNNAGEISIYRGRLTQRNGQLGFGLGELDQTVVRLREQLRSLEIETQTQILHRHERSGDASVYDSQFDPLEMDRFSRLHQLSGSLAETVNDLISVKEILGGYHREITDLLTQQARLADDLQDGLLRTRLVPFVQVVPRLHRLVRQTADSLGKSARLEVIGPEVELDRTILDRLVAPLEHLLRNAVDHGLEDTKTRVAKGKPATGMVTLALRREGNDAVISLGDDGKGLDLEAIRKQAIARGLMAPEAKLPDEALLQFILEPGFTTSGKVTQISGRGVGLDVVASEIKTANGTISLESVPGRGARFTIRLPLTLAIIDAFLVSVGENIYAVPHSTVEGAARVTRDELMAIYGDEARTYSTRGHHYKVVYLGSVLEPGQEPELGERRWMPLLLARIGDQRVALQVDNLIESQRILVKPLGSQLTGVRWLSGGTILPDGRVALILDALALLRSGAVRDYKPVATTAPEPTSVATCVMVVDDSLTVRRVTSRLLRRQNLEVLTAKDGVEALTLLDERIPDLILLDIEMPRMDGYELTRHIRRSERLRNLPIIMITSRTGAKHRDYAMQLGVNRYLGKPYQEFDLLNEINSLLAERHA